jgi:hypothetical protein
LTTIPPNALSEFRVVIDAMKAEYGINSGAVIMSTTCGRQSVSRQKSSSGGHRIGIQPSACGFLFTVETL